MENRGATLMELLLAFAVSAVVLAGLSYLLFTGLRLYDRNDVNTRVQNEAQNALNLLTDHMMEAGGVCMEGVASNPDIQCLLIDGLEFETPAGGYDAWFRGEAVIVRLRDGAGDYVGEVYLVSFPIEGDADLPEKRDGAGHVIQNQLAASAATQALAAEAARNKVLSWFQGLPEERRRAWLMAEHVTACEIVPADGVNPTAREITYEDGSKEKEYYYQAPFGFRVSMTFELESQTGSSVRTVEDTVYVRNRLPGVWISYGGGMQEYLDILGR